MMNNILNLSKRHLSMMVTPLGKKMYNSVFSDLFATCKTACVAQDNGSFTLCQCSLRMEGRD